MKHVQLSTSGLILAAMFVFAAASATAQTTANGPYYATPSWDQTLPANTRFIVLSNFNSQAVLDRETGLVWERSPSAAAQGWNDAHRHCNRETVIADRLGWRLPAIQELASLFDRTKSGPPLPTGHPFTNVQLTWYWSANSNAASANFAWVANFAFEGFTDIALKGTQFPAWCVRGGQGVDLQ